jgi:hypothetical protein
MASGESATTSPSKKMEEIRVSMEDIWKKSPKIVKNGHVLCDFIL